MELGSGVLWHSLENNFTRNAHALINPWPLFGDYTLTLDPISWHFSRCWRIYASANEVIIDYMITSSNGNIFRVTGPLYGEFTGPCFEVSSICVRINDWVDNGEAGDLWRYPVQSDVIVIKYWLVTLMTMSWHGNFLYYWPFVRIILSLTGVLPSERSNNTPLRCLRFC